jgi:hypothetical protein
MPTSRSSSSLNTRIFSPTVVLQQDTKRFEIKIRTNSGYIIDAGITAGDCIYYDPGIPGVSGGYYQSQAVDGSAEVVGVVESIAAGEYTVVTSGSIKYPSERLNLITDSDDTKIDILFLDNAPATNPGGLTGQVKIPTGTDSAIVKPVIQIAPHEGGYNGIVLNYLGYKIGNSASAQAAPESAGIIIDVPQDGDPGSSYRNLSEDNLLSVDEYPNAYEIVGLTNGPYIVKITMSSSAGISSTLVGKTAIQYNKTIGTVVEATGNTISISTTNNLPTISTGVNFYANSVAFLPISKQITYFSLPKQSPTTIGNIVFNKWMAVAPTTKIVIPEQLQVTEAVIDTLSVGNYASVEAILDSLQQQINEIKTRVGM